MNNGANIVYADGGLGLVLVNSGRISTNDANLTTLVQRYCIKKSDKERGFRELAPGRRAVGYGNLHIQNPPVAIDDETWTYFDATFYGILSIAEGGRSTSYEHVYRFSNVAEINIGTDEEPDLYRYVQPGRRFSYTAPATSDPRIENRKISIPSKIDIFKMAPGPRTGLFRDGDPKRNLPGSSFVWEFYDLERENYGNYDELREYWRLTYFVPTADA